MLWEPWADCENCRFHFQSVALNIQAKVLVVLRKTIHIEISVDNTFERTRLPWCWAHTVCRAPALASVPWYPLELLQPLGSWGGVKT